MQYPTFISKQGKKLVYFVLAVLVVGLVLTRFSTSASNSSRTVLQDTKAPAPDQPQLVTNNYRQTNFISDLPGFAQIQDPNLVNPWGIAQLATSPFWVANQVSNTATLYGGDVGGSPISRNPLVVSIPGALPTGAVANGSSDFVITSGGGTGPARFMFASITGNIVAWRAGTIASIVSSQPGHVYTGLAIGGNGVQNFLFAADFANRKIDVYNTSFALTTSAGGFIDPTLPSDYAPHNIQNLGGTLYVAYAKIDPMTGESLAGAGNGYVSKFDTNGNLVGRLVSNGALNSPWGLVVAPVGFGAFPEALLVGNFGDGKINAYNFTTGAFLGTMNDEAGNPIVIDELWALTKGNGVGGGDTNAVYFSAGFDEENHGLFGSLRASVPSLATVQFSAATYSVNESAGSFDVTVNRFGDLSLPATVNYATYDDSEADSATQGKDYLLAAGTLNFAAGQVSKTFTIFITDDAYVETPEVVKIALSNPTGASLGSPNLATLTINSNDTSASVVSPTQRTFVGTLNGAQETPPNASTARGVGVLILDPGETTAKVSLFFSGLTAPATAAHIHGPAAPGVAAPVLFPFVGIPAATSGSVNNVSIALTATQLQQLKDGLFYFNVHNATFPNGEIRGQILYNPIDESSFFVRAQYNDFLNRNPEAGGLTFWTDHIESCLLNTLCISDRRVGTSAAFFVSTEFQQTGFFVYRVRRASLGTQPLYGQYVLDETLLGGGSEAQKTAFTEGFTQRPEFLQKYPASQSGTAYIDAVIATILSASGVDLTAKRPELVNEYLLGATQAQSRARVIRKAIEYPEYTTAEFNPAFVLSQYVGYLRRGPDPAGYAFWLSHLTPNGGNSRGMVCSFITSAEYQNRFGPTVTRNDKECLDITP